jgi:hypothetical protein
MWPFYVGAAADTVVGIALTAFSAEAAGLLLPEQAAILGLATASVIRFLGLFLILFALETVIVARATGTAARFRSWIVAANWATVALALLVLVLWHSALSTLGIAAVAAVAVSVGAFAALQHRAL